MPKREDDFWASQKEGLRYCTKHKRYYRADIGCQLCGYEQSRLKGKENDMPSLQECPKCKRKSLFWNEYSKLYECLNQKCKCKFNETSLRDSIEPELPPEKVDKGTSFNWKVPNWSTVMHSLTRIRRSRTARNVFRTIIKLFLSLLVIIGLADVSRRGYILFTQQTEPLRDTIIFLVEVGLWLWVISILRSRKYKYRKPKFKLVLVAIIAISLVCAFAGVQPMANYKDKAVDSVTSIVGEWQEQIAIKEAAQKAERAKQEAEEAARAEEESPKITLVEPPKVIIPPEKVVPVPLPSSPEISEDPTLRNPSWEELKAFLWEDKTDLLEYVFPTFICYDFARTLQASAKEAGWRCAYVCVQLEGYPDWFDYGIPSNTGHGLNVFETTDRGLVYIDCTSTHGFSGNADKIIDVKIGKEYIPKGIFPTPGWGEWVNMGTIVEIELVRW